MKDNKSVIVPRRLIYTATDAAFLPIAVANLRLIKHFNPNVEVLCITSKDVELPNEDLCWQWKVDNFWGFGDTRYRITEWEQFGSFDSFVYLDADAMCFESLDHWWPLIEAEPQFIHAKYDMVDINEDVGHARFYRTEPYYVPRNLTLHGYCSGVFGFSKPSGIQVELVAKCIRLPHNMKRVGRFTDQVIFNEELWKILRPTLQPFVYNWYKMFKRFAPMMPLEHCQIWHPVGRVNKMDLIKGFFMENPWIECPAHIF